MNAETVERAIMHLKNLRRAYIEELAAKQGKWPHDDGNWSWSTSGHRPDFLSSLEADIRILELDLARFALGL